MERHCASIVLHEHRGLGLCTIPGGITVPGGVCEKKERDIQTIAAQTDSSRTMTKHMAPSIVLLHQHLGNYDRICHGVQGVLPRTYPITSFLYRQSATCRDLHTDGSPGQTCSSVTWCTAAISKSTSAATVVRNETKTRKIKQIREGTGNLSSS
jgi:hypothetical protein